MTPEQRKHFEFVRDEMHGEPEQQKVVWDEKIGGIGFDVPMPNANYKVTATVVPKQNQEPVAWKATWGGETKVFLYAKPNPTDYDEVIPLYATPQQRKPLTPEQFQAICNSLSRQGGWDVDDWDLALKEAIEAAHGIRPSDFKE